MIPCRARDGDDIRGSRHRSRLKDCDCLSEYAEAIEDRRRVGARNLRDREFIGTGLAFPLQFSPRGEIALATGEHDIEFKVNQAKNFLLHRIYRQKSHLPT